jgi:CBS domain-containing protein
MRVRDVMTIDVKTIQACESCYEAARRMSQHRIHHLAVLGDGPVLEGVVTDRDLRADFLATVARATEVQPVDVEAALRQRPVREIMSTPVVTVGVDEELAVAATVMAERRIGSLPVVQDGRLVGMLTETDILNVLFRRRIFSSVEVESIFLFAA